MIQHFSKRHKIMGAKLIKILHLFTALSITSKNVFRHWSQVDEKTKKEALVDSICNSLLANLLDETSKIFLVKKTKQPGKTSAQISPIGDPAPASPSPKMRIEKMAEQITVPLSPWSSRPIQEMLLTTFDIGSDSSEGNF